MVVQSSVRALPYASTTKRVNSDDVHCSSTFRSKLSTRARSAPPNPARSRGSIRKGYIRRAPAQTFSSSTHFTDSHYCPPADLILSRRSLPQVLERCLGLSWSACHPFRGGLSTWRRVPYQRSHMFFGASSNTMIFVYFYRGMRRPREVKGYRQSV